MINRASFLEASNLEDAINECLLAAVGDYDPERETKASVDLVNAFTAATDWTIDARPRMTPTVGGKTLLIPPRFSIGCARWLGADKDTDPPRVKVHFSDLLKQADNVVASIGDKFYDPLRTDGEYSFPENIAANHIAEALATQARQLSAYVIYDCDPEPEWDWAAWEGDHAHLSAERRAILRADITYGGGSND